MRKEKISVIVLAIAFVALLITHFAVLAPLAASGDGDGGTTLPPVTDPGEGSVGDRYLLIDRQIERKEIQSIKVINGSGDYMFVKQKITLAPVAGENYSESGSFSNSKKDVVNYYLDENESLQPIYARVSSTVGDSVSYKNNMRGSYTVYVYIVTDDGDAPDSSMKVTLTSGETTAEKTVKTRGSSGKYTYADGSWVKLGTFKLDGELTIKLENVSGNLNVGNIRFIQNEHDESAAADFSEPVTTSNYKDGETFLISGRSILTYDPDKFSYLVTSVGYPLASMQVEKNVSAEKLAEYGLAPEQNPNKYELITTSGKLYRVAVGDKISSGGGYYMQNLERDTVYILAYNSMYSPGEVIEQPLEYYVDPTVCTPAESTYSYSYIDGFTIFKNGQLIDTVGTPVKEEQILDVTYTIRDENGQVYNNNIDVKNSIAIIDSEEFPKKFLDNIRGRCVGESFSFTYVDQGKTLTYEMKINYAMELELFLLIDRNAADEGDISSFYSAFKMLFPLTKYGVNEDAHLNLLQKLTELEGSETVAIGLSDEIMKKYGLYKTQISFDMPYGVTTDERGNIVCDQVMTNSLYVSDIQPGGFYYVGVLIYDTVVKVPAEELTFLDWDVLNWVDYQLFSVNIKDVTDMTFSSSKGDYHFRLGSMLANGKSVLHVTDLNSGFVVGSNMSDFDTQGSEVFKEFYKAVLGIHYEGDADLTKEEMEALTASDSNCLLTYSFTLADGRVFTYKFYPYSERRCLVVRDGEGFFCTATYSVKKVISDIELLIEGKTPDWNSRY